MGFPSKKDHFGVLWGYHYLRKHPYRSVVHYVQWRLLYESSLQFSTGEPREKAPDGGDPSVGWLVVVWFSRTPSLQQASEIKKTWASFDMFVMLLILASLQTFACQTLEKLRKVDIVFLWLNAKLSDRLPKFQVLKPDIVIRVTSIIQTSFKQHCLVISA